MSSLLKPSSYMFLSGVLVAAWLTSGQHNTGAANNCNGMCFYRNFEEFCNFRMLPEVSCKSHKITSGSKLFPPQLLLFVIKIENLIFVFLFVESRIDMSSWCHGNLFFKNPLQRQRGATVGSRRAASNIMTTTALMAVMCHFFLRIIVFNILLFLSRTFSS